MFEINSVFFSIFHLLAIRCRVGKGLLGFPGGHQVRCFISPVLSPSYRPECLIHLPRDFCNFAPWHLRLIEGDLRGLKMAVCFYPFVSILKLFHFYSVENRATFPFERDSVEELAGDCQIFERMGTRKKLLISDFPHTIYLGS